jgi:hypothetical protein
MLGIEDDEDKEDEELEESTSFTSKWTRRSPDDGRAALWTGRSSRNFEPSTVVNDKGRDKARRGREGIDGR